MLAKLVKNNMNGYYIYLKGDENVYPPLHIGNKKAVELAGTNYLPPTGTVVLFKV